MCIHNSRPPSGVTVVTVSGPTHGVHMSLTHPACPQTRPDTPPLGPCLSPRCACRVTHQSQSLRPEQTPTDTTSDDVNTDTDADPDQSTPDTQSTQTDAQSVSDQEQVSVDPAVRALIDRGAGTGAYSGSEDWVRANSRPESNDGRSPTRTTFYPDDVSTRGPGQAHRDQSDRRSWRSLASWNDGVQSDISRGTQNWEADKQRWIDTITSQLATTSYQRDRVAYLLDTIDYRPYQSGQYPVEHVILALTTLVLDQSVSDWDHRALNRDDVLQLAQDFDVGASRDDVVDTLMDIRRLLKTKDGDVIFSD